MPGWINWLIGALVAGLTFVGLWFRGEAHKARAARQRQRADEAGAVVEQRQRQDEALHETRERHREEAEETEQKIRDRDRDNFEDSW